MNKHQRSQHTCGGMPGRRTDRLDARRCCCCCTVTATPLVLAVADESPSPLVAATGGTPANSTPSPSGLPPCCLAR